MPTPIPDGYTPHGTYNAGKGRVHLRGPDARTLRAGDRSAAENGRWGPTLCNQGNPPAYIRGEIHTLEQITCTTCRLLGRHAAATTQTRQTPPSA